MSARIFLAVAEPFPRACGATSLMMVWPACTFDEVGVKVPRVHDNSALTVRSRYS